MNKLEQFKDWFASKHGYYPDFLKKEDFVQYECFCAGYDCAFADFCLEDDSESWES